MAMAEELFIGNERVGHCECRYVVYLTYICICPSAHICICVLSVCLSVFSVRMYGCLSDPVSLRLRPVCVCMSRPLSHSSFASEPSLAVVLVVDIVARNMCEMGSFSLSLPVSFLSR